LARTWARNEGLGGRITRRRFLGALSAGAAGIALTGTFGCGQSPRTLASASSEGPGRASTYRTRPDLRPPAIEVNASSPGTAPGYIFVSPKKEPGGLAPSQDAPLIVDGSGEPVWFHPVRDSGADAFNFEVQVLPDGNLFVGWGSEPFFSEFSRDGELLFDAGFPPTVESYRAFRFPWKGEPQTRPAVVAESGDGDKVEVYVSWNGATEVATCQVLAGPGPDELGPVGSVPRNGFETAVTLQTDETYLAVKTGDGSGKELATSRAFKPQDQKRA
jgi:hypothetical protein